MKFISQLPLFTNAYFRFFLSALPMMVSQIPGIDQTKTRPATLLVSTNGVN